VAFGGPDLLFHQPGSGFYGCAGLDDPWGTIHDVQFPGVFLVSASVIISQAKNFADTKSGNFKELTGLKNR